MLQREVLSELLCDKTLELILFPTEQCNFRCTYCYENFANGRMSTHTIKGIKRYLQRRIPTLSRLHLEWFGGEPLVAKDIVMELTAYAAVLAKNAGIEYFRSGMTTNGYELKPRTFTKLAEIGVLDFQISLDGPPEFHNQTRVKVNGEGTFNQIWNNLLYIRKTEFPFTMCLRIHLLKSNIDKIDLLIEKIKDNFIDDKRFSVLLKPIEKLGGKNDEQLDVLTESQKMRTISNINRQLYGEHYIDEDDKFQMCYASKPNSFIIRSDGTIAKCTVKLNNPNNWIGKITNDGHLHLNKKEYLHWIRGITTLDKETLFCPFKNFPT